MKQERPAALSGVPLIAKSRSSSAWWMSTRCSGGSIVSGPCLMAACSNRTPFTTRPIPLFARAAGSCAFVSRLHRPRGDRSARSSRARRPHQSRVVADAARASPASKRDSKENGSFTIRVVGLRFSDLSACGRGFATRNTDPSFGCRASTCTSTRHQRAIFWNSKVRPGPSIAPPRRWDSRDANTSAERIGTFTPPIAAAKASGLEICCSFDKFFVNGPLFA